MIRNLSGIRLLSKKPAEYALTQSDTLCQMFGSIECIASLKLQVLVLVLIFFYKIYGALVCSDDANEVNDNVITNGFKIFCRLKNFHKSRKTVGCPVALFVLLLVASVVFYFRSVFPNILACLGYR